MALFTIGDLHLSLGTDKPMDVFPGWDGYMARLEANWRKLVAASDTVVLAGDISWAMKLENCVQDFAFIQAMPGKKIILKGNHDYWWGTVSKMERFLADNAFDSISFLYNNAYLLNGMALCGTRSWLFDPGEQHDVKVMNREIGRLRASLEAANKLDAQAEKIVFLHYPPIYSGTSSPEVIELMREYGVKRCFYAHLHAQAIRWAVQGTHGGIIYKLVSADALGFTPCYIYTNGAGEEGFGVDMENSVE